MDTTVSAIGGLNGADWKQQMLFSEANKKEQVEQVAKEFEGILIRQFLDSALTPMDRDSGMFGVKSSPMYEQLIKDSLATAITKKSSLGFSSVLQSQLFPQSLTTEKGADSHE